MSKDIVKKRSKGNCTPDVFCNDCGCEHEIYCCEPKCPPKVPARFMRRVDRDFREVSFFLKSNDCTGTSSIPYLANCIEVAIRRQGYCKVLHYFKPYRVDLSSGKFWVRWSEFIRRLPADQYELDVYVDGCIYNTIGLVFVDIPLPVEMEQDIRYTKEPCLCVEDDVVQEGGCGC